MQKPQAVVFDLGKVLLDFDYAKLARNMKEHCSVTFEELLGALNQSKLLHRYETGSITSQNFFEEVKRASKFRHDFDVFEPLFADIFTPIPELIALQQGLRKAGMPTYIFSNTNEIAVKYIRRTYPFFADFSGYVFSYEQGAMKPEPRIYEAVEEMTGRRGKELLYIDDRPENIDQGVERGWQTILHVEPAKTISRVELLVGSSSNVGADVRRL
jgi:FMN phosphatase YigB (HAD superfamily)